MPKVVNYVKSSWGWFFKPDAWGYPAVIVWIIELWTEWKDYKKDWNIKDVEEIRIVYEIEAEQEEQEKQWEWDDAKYVGTGKKVETIWTIGQNYTTVISDNSKLWKVIKAIYDVKSMDEIKGFSLDSLLWINCYIDVDLVWKEKNFPVVKTATALNKKFEAMLHETETKPFYFGMDDQNDFIDWFEEDLKKHLPSWEVDRIKASPEYKKLMISFWIEIPETLEEQDVNIEDEIAENKASKPASEEEAWEIFNNDEPASTTKARENAKSETPKEEDPFEES